VFDVVKATIHLSRITLQEKAKNSDAETESKLTEAVDDK